MYGLQESYVIVTLHNIGLDFFNRKSKLEYVLIFPLIVLINILYSYKEVRRQH